MQNNFKIGLRNFCCVKYLFFCKMSAATINQDFQVISNAIQAISTLNGNVTLDTQPTGVVDVKHAGTTVSKVANDGSVEITAKPGKNINRTTSDSGNTVISDLQISHEYEYVEEVTVSHDLKNTFSYNSYSY